VATYLLDTDVLSELMSTPRLTRRRNIEAWLRSLGGEAVVLSSVSIAEINRGAALVKNRVIAASIRNGLDQITSIYDDAIITPSHEEWQTFARLSAVPELRRLCHGKNKKNLPRTGADGFLAIQAVTIRCAIATCNAADFALIDRHLPIIGGIVNPATGAWIREPDAADEGDCPDYTETSG
jgi:predicted nucleic acid-binding protein